MTQVIHTHFMNIPVFQYNTIPGSCGARNLYISVFDLELESKATQVELRLSLLVENARLLRIAEKLQGSLVQCL